MSMEDRDGWIWLDGTLVAWREARVHALSLTLHHGIGVFEGLRVYEGNLGSAVFRAHEHTNRLFRSAHLLQIEIPFSSDQINGAMLDVIVENALREAYIRPIVYCGGDRVGVSPIGNRVHVAIAAWPWKEYLGEAAREQGIRVKTSSFTRPHLASGLGKAKACGNYVLASLARGEAVQAGFDEALLLDPQGHVAEASTENVFIVRNGQLITPEPANVLEGITRSTIMTLARDRNIEVVEHRVTRDDVYTAEEMFLTGTAAEVIPVREVDFRVIGSGRPGAVTRLLQQAYFDCVRGKDRLHGVWLLRAARAAPSASQS